MTRQPIIDFIRATSNSPTALARILKVSPQRADQLLHPKKHLARVKVDKALKPQACQICRTKSDDLEAHHYNYDKPELVIWTCVSCHNLVG
jgi:hypothetical protein